MTIEHNISIKNGMLENSLFKKKRTFIDTSFLGKKLLLVKLMTNLYLMTH